MGCGGYSAFASCWHCVRRCGIGGEVHEAVAVRDVKGVGGLKVAPEVRVTEEGVVAG